MSASADRAPVTLEGVCLVPVEQLREHSQAALVPSMTDEEYLAFLADLRKRGLLTPLEVTGENVVLDGHHRLRAARELQLPEVPVRVVTVEDEVERMLLSALRRRNLSVSQRAAMAVRLGSYREEKEKARQRSQGNLRRGPGGQRCPLGEVSSAPGPQVWLESVSERSRMPLAFTRTTSNSSRR